MTLQYEEAFHLKSTAVTALDISKSGSKLAAITKDGFIDIWDVPSKSRYSPRAGPAPDGSCILWVSDATFICGFLDGNTLTGSLKKNPQTTKDELSLRSKRLASQPIRTLSFNRHTNLLAVGDDDGVRLWKSGMNDWIYHKDLPSPRREASQGSENLGVTVVDWLENEILLVAYLNTGIVIWNTETLTIERSFQPQRDRQICTGTVCHEAEKLVAVNELNMVDIYDVVSGEPWSPPQLDNVFTVKSLHQGSGFLAGRHNETYWIDISKTRVSQVLHQESSTLDRVVAMSAFEDESEGVYLIATGSAEKSVIWKAAIEDHAVGGESDTRSSQSSEESWFSWLSRKF